MPEPTTASSPGHSDDPPGHSDDPPGHSDDPPGHSDDPPGHSDDPTSATPTVKIDNERVRVTEWRFAPGAATGHHRHEFPYVVVPMTTGSLTSIGSDGETTARLVAGEPYFRMAGVEHDVRNPNSVEFVFVEVELKTAL
jgi:beta-alanine degradation protein BauB